MSSNVELVCPTCRKILTSTDTTLKCLQCGVQFPIVQGIPILIPPNIDQLSSKEAKYHDEFEEDPVEVHQLNSLRNQYYHRLIREEVLKEGNCFLEVGGGSGHDARELLKNRGVHLVETDISSQTLLRSRLILKNQKEVSGTFQFVCCAIPALPFLDTSFDVTFCVAAIHHLSDVTAGLTEMGRVTRKNGKIIVGLEPNRFYFGKVKKFRRCLCRMTHTSAENVSEADAEMEGYSEDEIRKYWQEAGLHVVKIIPAWFTLGILHYALEFAFRSLRLKRRIKVPYFMEATLLYFDQFVFSIPKLKYFGWHWIVFATR